MNKDFFKSRKVLVMGLGRFGGGLDTAKFACRAGANVIVTDLADAGKLAESINQLQEFSNIEYHLGGHCAVDFSSADIVIVNPAVKPENELLAAARRQGAVVTSQIEIFFELCPAFIIGITGSNGKSTTTALTAHLLKDGRQKPALSEAEGTEDRGQKTEGGGISNNEQGIMNDEMKATPETKYEIRDTRYENVWLGGNLGNLPLLARLEQIKADDLVVLELSSFQLEQLAQSNYAPNLALITNLAPNHLDRHGTFEAYLRAKENIFALQRPDKNRPPVSIFNADDPLTLQWFEKYKNQTGRICLTFSARQISGALRESFPLPGRANLENLAAAVSIAGYFGLDEEKLRDAAATFKSLPHRLELVAEINGTRWYNDSVSTTPESSIVALQAFSRPKVIIAGGYDKGVSLEELGRQIAQKAKAAVLIGQTAEKIEKEVKKQLATEGTEDTEIKLKNKIIIKKAGSLSEAVRLSAGLAGPGEVVLLSPGCASYVLFDDFRHRGEVFRECVKKLSV